LKRERQLERLAADLEEGEFEPSPDPAGKWDHREARMAFRLFASLFTSGVLVVAFEVLSPGWDRGVVTAFEAAGLLFCGFNAWEARKHERARRARIWFVLGFVLLAGLEFAHARPDIVRSILRSVDEG